MAASMTYSSLVQDIKDYAERSDKPFVDQIPRFIMMAENRIASEIRGLGYVRFVTGTFAPGDAVVAKPERWRETSSLSITPIGLPSKFLKSRSYSFCKTYWPLQTVEGSPEYYADYGYEHLLIVPTPSADTVFELSYYERPVPLSSDNQTNWTTQYAPQLLLYATLLEAQPFLKLSERIGEFQALFDRAAAGVMNESSRLMSGDQTLARSGTQ